jgi:hypothetical protein
MKILALTCTFMVVVLLTQGIAQAQTQYPALRNEPHRLETPQELTTARIANLIRSRVPISNLRVPLLHRMGDGAAIEVQNIMKTRGPLSPTEQQNVLQILHRAFESPGAIMKDSNRKPDVSMALLQQLSGSATDAALQAQIVDTQQFIFEATLRK